MKVLVVAAHPDDEALGCGGTIARHAAAGDEVTFVFMADGVTSRNADEEPMDAIERRRRAQYQAAVALSVGNRTPIYPQSTLWHRDNNMDYGTLLVFVREIEPTIKAFQPDIIYTHHGGDLNIDHRITHQAVMTACRPMPGSSVKAIYAFEVPSSTEWASEAEQAFRPNHFVDITSTLDKKIDALKAYEEEMRPFPHARSMEAVKALAMWRGASVGLRAAEAFMTLRRIEA